MQIAELYTRSYYEDMDALGVLRPDIAPRATGHIVEQIEMVKALLARGLAYEVRGSVYFDVQHFAGYGKLSRRSIDELTAGARVEVNPDKRHPADFALWKRAEPGHIMRWPSPWGEGFPGWHIECSAMSMKYLGETFDIHGGGLENQFPHHECEIAQSEGATGKPFAKYWLHNNMVTVDGKKMGKSLGNSITLKDAFAQWNPQVIRFFVLQSHYRSTLDFSNDAVEAAAKGLEKLNNTVRNLRDALRTAPPDGEPLALKTEAYRAAFLSAMDDDFNSPQAIAVLFDLARDVNQALGQGKQYAGSSLTPVAAMFDEQGNGILGLGGVQERVAADGRTEKELMDLLIDVRGEIRLQKLWGLSDKIRDGLVRIGFTLEDKKEGTSWRKTL